MHEQPDISFCKAAKVNKAKYGAIGHANTFVTGYHGWGGGHRGPSLPRAWAAWQPSKGRLHTLAAEYSASVFLMSDVIISNMLFRFHEFILGETLGKLELFLVPEVKVVGVLWFIFLILVCVYCVICGQERWPGDAAGATMEEESPGLWGTQKGANATHAPRGRG